MKYHLAFVSICALLLAAACSQSPEKLMAAANKYHQKKKYEEASILYRKVLQKDKTNAEAYYREGLNLLDQGKIGEAVGCLRRAVDLRPSNSDAAAKLAEIYLTAYAQDPKRYKTLLPDVQDLDEKILQRNTNSFEGLRIHALLQLADNDRTKALETFAKANRIKPHSRDLIGWYAETLVAVGKPEEATALVQDTLAQDKTWGQGYDFLFLRYGQSGQPAKAEEVLRQRVRNSPADPIAIQNLANYLLASNRYNDAETAMHKVLEGPKPVANGREMMGDFYVRAKRYDQALSEYQQGQKENPKDSKKYQERIVALQELTGHPDQAAQLAKDLAEKNPKDASANEMYASILLQSGSKADATKSLEQLKKLVENNPADAVLHLDLARAYFGLNDNDRALAEAQESMQLEQKSAAPRARVTIAARTVEARIYEDRGQHVKALEQADVILGAQPGNPDAALIRCRALIGTNEAEKAQPELEKLVQQFPRMSDARMYLAELYLGQRQYDKAAAQFQQIMDTNPRDMRGFIGLQTVKLATGKEAEALVAMQDLVQKNPSVAQYRYQLANFEVSSAEVAGKSNPEHAKELIEQAAGNYKQILKTATNWVDAWMRLGVVQRQLGQYDNAIASFEQAGTADPKNANAFLNEALLYDALGKKKEAQDAYNKVLGIESDNALALNNLAYLDAEAGTNLDQAMTFAERAKKKAPNSADISDTLGYVYYQKNLNSEALQIFRQNVQAYPQNPTFHFHLAMALLKQGDKRAAREEAQKAIPNAPPGLQNKIRSFVSQIG